MPTTVTLVGDAFKNELGEEFINVQIKHEGYGVETYAIPVPHPLDEAKVQYIKATRERLACSLKLAKDISELFPQWKPAQYIQGAERVVWRDREVVKEVRVEVLPQVMKDNITNEINVLTEQMGDLLQRMTTLARMLPVENPYGDNSNDYSASGLIQRSIEKLSSARWTLDDACYALRADNLFKPTQTREEYANSLGDNDDCPF